MAAKEVLVCESENKYTYNYGWQLICYNRRQKVLEQLRKTTSYLAPQVMKDHLKDHPRWG